MAQWKKVIVSGSKAELGQVSLGSNQLITTSSADTRLSGSFSGSFFGDGSGLTGLATNLNFSSSNGSGSTVDLKLQDLIFDSNPNHLQSSVSASTLTYEFVENIKHTGSVDVLGTVSSTTGSFGRIESADSSTIHPITASWAANAESTALNSGKVIHISPASSTWNVKHNLSTFFPIVEIWDESTNRVVQPDEITSLDEQTVEITFTTPVAGYANISRAGHVVSGSTLWTNLTGPANVTASLTLTGSISVIDGNISGSFIGDGTGLTGVTAEWDGSHIGDASITGSLTVSGSAGSKVDLTGVDEISGSIFSGSFVGDGSGLTGLVTNLTFSGSNGSSSSIDLKDEGLFFTSSDTSIITSTTGNKVDITLSNNIIGSGSFSGSFEGDGSGLTGIASSLAFSGSNGTSGSLNLKDEGLLVSTSDNNVVVTADGNALNLALATNIVHSGSISGSSLITVESGSFQALTTPHLVVNNLTASYALKAETEALNSGISQFFSSNTVWTVDHELNTIAPLVEVWDSTSNTVVIPAEVKALTQNRVQITFDSVTEGYVNISRAGHVVSGSVLWTALTGPADVTASLDISGSLTSNGLVDFTEATAISGSIFSGSFVGDGSGLTGIASTLVFSGSNGTSSSLSLKDEGLVVSSSDNNLVTDASGNVLNLTLSDTLSASGSFSGSFEGDGSNLTGVVSASHASTASYVNTLTQNVRVEGDIEATGNIIAQQYIVSSSVSYITESFSSGSTIFGDTTDDTHQIIGSLIVSGAKADFTDTPAISGSIFSGSFVGDGSGLTGLVSSLSFSGSNGTSSSINLKDEGLFFSSSDKGVVVNASGSTIKVDLADRIATSHIEATTLSGSLSGSFNGDLAADSGYLSGSFAGTGSGFFSGSFEGDGSGLTGLATNLNFSSSNGSGSTLDLKLEDLVLTGNPNHLQSSVSASTVTYEFVENIKHTGSLDILGTVSASTGSFGRIESTTGITHPITASWAANAETTALNSGKVIHITPASDTWTIKHGLATFFPIVEIWDESTNRIVQPDEVTSIDDTTVEVTFTTPVAGYANISRAGHVVSGSVLWENLTGPANVTASLVLTGSLSVVDGDISGSFIGDGSGLTGVTAEWDGTHIGTGIISGSLIVSGGKVDFTDTPAISGSIFSGSFVGDGSGLTGLVTVLNFSGSAGTGSVDLKEASLNLVTGSKDQLLITASGDTVTFSISDTAEISGSFSGSFQGDGSGLTGVTAEWDGTHNGSATISGSLLVSGGVIDFTDTPAISGSIFSGSFVGDGSGLTGLVTELNFTGSDGSNSSIDLKSTGLLFSSSVNNLVSTVSSSTVTYNLADRIITTAAEFTSASGSFSGSFEGDGSGLTGIASTLFITASNTPGSVNLKTEALTITGSVNEVEVSFNDTTNTLQVGLTDNVTVTNNLTVGGNLTVEGTTTSLETTNLFIEDRWALFASGSNVEVDGGIIIQSGSNGSGYAFGLDNSAQRWAFQDGLTDGTNNITPDAFVTTTEFGLASAQPAVPTYGGASNGYGNIWVSTDTGEIYIYT